MGSSGSGNFSDYSGNKPQPGKQNGGSSGRNKCGNAFKTTVDEVARCEYFEQHEGVPPKNTEVTIRVQNSRPAVFAEDELVGYLPTDYNYVVMCMTDGFRYSGVVSISKMRPVPAVQVSITPES